VRKCNRPFFRMAIGVVRACWPASSARRIRALARRRGNALGSMFQAGLRQRILDASALQQPTIRTGTLLPPTLIPRTSKPRIFQEWITEAYQKTPRWRKDASQMMALAGFKVKWALPPRRPPMPRKARMLPRRPAAAPQAPAVGGVQTSPAKSRRRSERPAGKPRAARPI